MQTSASTDSSPSTVSIAASPARSRHAMRASCQRRKRRSAVHELLVVRVRADRLCQPLFEPALIGGLVQTPRAREPGEPRRIPQAGLGDEPAAQPRRSATCCEHRHPVRRPTRSRSAARSSPRSPDETPPGPDPDRIPCSWVSAPRPRRARGPPSDRSARQATAAARRGRTARPGICQRRRPPMKVAKTMREETRADHRRDAEHRAVGALQLALLVADRPAVSSAPARTVPRGPRARCSGMAIRNTAPVGAIAYTTKPIDAERETREQRTSLAEPCDQRPDERALHDRRSSRRRAQARARPCAPATHSG